SCWVVWCIDDRPAVLLYAAVWIQVAVRTSFDALLGVAEKMDARKLPDCSSRILSALVVQQSAGGFDFGFFDSGLRVVGRVCICANSISSQSHAVFYCYRRPHHSRSRHADSGIPADDKTGNLRHALGVD